MTTEQTPELKPCPFCGGEAEVEDNRLSFLTRCTNCNAALRGESYYYLDHLPEGERGAAIEAVDWDAVVQATIAKWNVRTSEALVAAAYQDAEQEVRRGERDGDGWNLSRRTPADARAAYDAAMAQAVQVERKRAERLHRRAQKAEGKLSRTNAWLTTMLDWISEQNPKPKDLPLGRIKAWISAAQNASRNGSNIASFLTCPYFMGREKRLIAQARAEGRRERVTVKPLVWEDDSIATRQRAFAESPFGGYTVTTSFMDGIDYWIAGPFGREKVTGDFEFAKRCCQIKHEHLALSALSDAPAPAVDPEAPAVPRDSAWQPQDAPAPAVTVAEAARMLLSATPNPVFDHLKPVLMGEFSERIEVADEDGEPQMVSVPVSWDVTKQIVAAAFRALAEGGAGRG